MGPAGSKGITKVTKRSKAMARKISWNTAIAEGRVVRSQGSCVGPMFHSFVTTSAALAAVARMQAAGLEADVVAPGLALAEYVAKGGR